MHANFEEPGTPSPSSASSPAAWADTEPAAPPVEPLRALPPEEWPNIDHIETEDGVPVESVRIEKQYRLLTEPLYSCWPGPGEGRPFVVMANVGLFFAVSHPPLVPDVMLSLDIQMPEDLTQKYHRSYFIWYYGKPPELVIEIVSDRRGGEDTFKLKQYAHLGIDYYVIYDPVNHLGGGVLRTYELRGGRYALLERPWFPPLGLGGMLWQGSYEGHHVEWLRWCDAQGQLIPTGQERAEQERQRAEQERQRAEQERQRAEQEHERVARLEAQLRALGVDPSA